MMKAFAPLSKALLAKEKQKKQTGKIDFYGRENPHRADPWA